MNDFFSALTAFTQSTSIYVYLFIFFGKIIEVSIATVRIVLINRGERVVGSLIAMLEMLIWLTITGTVLAGYQSDFIKIPVFCVAFAVGNFLGSWLEERLAFGLCAIQAVVADDETASYVAGVLREQGYGVTILRVEGRENPHSMLMTTIKRKLAHEAMDLIRKTCPCAVVTVSDVKSITGGYLKSSTARRARRITK